MSEQELLAELRAVAQLWKRGSVLNDTPYDEQAPDHHERVGQILAVFIEASDRLMEQALAAPAPRRRGYEFL